MHTSAPTPPSCIPGRPTIVLIAPQGVGKTLFAAALTRMLGCTHCIDGEDLNGSPAANIDDVPTDGALILTNDPAASGGDLTITAHNIHGFEALLRALDIPTEWRTGCASYERALAAFCARQAAKFRG